MSEHDPRIVIEWLGGNCPVQAEGTVAGLPFYFRARGQRWTLGIGHDPIGDPEWHHEEPYGEEQFDAGWMDYGDARLFLIREATRFLAEMDAAEAEDGQPDEAQEWADFDAEC